MYPLICKWSAHLAVVLALASGTAATQAQPAAPVSVGEAQRLPIYRTIPLTGTVTALRSSRLSAATSGLVNSLSVDAGSRVSRGDVVLELDSELAALNVRSAEARVKQAESALADARRRLREARELIPQASIAESAVRDLEAEVSLDEAALQQSRAEAEFERAVLERHKLKAPFDGVVSAKLTELGEWVTPGQAVLALVATDTVRLDFPVAEDYLYAIDSASEVHYRVGADTQAKFRGEVETTVPVTDPNARTFLLRVAPTGDRPVLKPGMSVRATLKLPAGRDGLAVPRDAILRYPDGRTVVWSVQRSQQGDTVQEVVVRTGLQFDGLVEITGGLEAGTRVVVEGNEALRNGQSVDIRAGTVAAGRGS